MQREYNKVTKLLRRRNEPVNYLDEESEGEIDYVYEESEKSSLYSCSDNDDDSENEKEKIDVEDEPEEDETNLLEDSRKKTFFYGKNGHKWSTKLPDREQKPRLLNDQPKKKGDTPFDFWNLLFTDSMFDILVKYTNAEIENYRNLNECTYISTNVTKIEIQAYIGLLYLSGYQRQNNVTIEELWSDEFGSSLYRETMTEIRFKFISSMLRFDDKNTRNIRQETDTLAPIRELWDAFIENCQINYEPSDFLTIDKQLLNFRGKFSARVYIKSKPAKYGIKIITLNDAKTFYLFNAIPFIGRVNTERGESISDYYIRNLCQPIYGTKRNITTNNRFTSIDIFNKMKDQYMLTMIGTLRKNKRYIPVSFKQTASAGTTRYGYDGKNILLSYYPKRNKVILYLSSYHESVSQESEDKPKIIQMYNETKCGTKVFNSLCNSFSCSRKTRRWPIRFFMGILDQAGVNACILYNFQSENSGKDRCQFLKELVLELVTPNMKNKSQISDLSRNLVVKIQPEFIDPDKCVDLNDKLEKRKRCALCSVKKDRKTINCCVKCRLPICPDHKFSCCEKCLPWMS